MTPPESQAQYWNSGPGLPPDNMAWDEVLLSQANQCGQALLRFYAWKQPAATFGYFQRYAEVAELTPLRPLIRRPTGGGLVPHDHDWTYALAFPPRSSWYSLKARDSYRQLHAWVQSSLAPLQVAATLAECCDQQGPGQCFLGAEVSDLMWEGKKIAGAAQRRTRQGLLIQGSIQPPTGLEREVWERSFLETGWKRHGFQWAPYNPDDSTKARAQELAAEKYGHPDFIRKR